VTVKVNNSSVAFEEKEVEAKEDKVWVGRGGILYFDLGAGGARFD
jgi:hypothetical protein